jgi:hypothetical protein
MKNQPTMRKLNSWLLLSLILLVPLQALSQDDSRLNLCLDALSTRDKEVADLKILCDQKGKTSYEAELQRDKAYLLAEKGTPTPILAYVLMGSSLLATSIGCGFGGPNFCLLTAGFMVGTVGMFTIYHW